MYKLVIVFEDGSKMVGDLYYSFFEAMKCVEEFNACPPTVDAYMYAKKVH